MKADIRKQVSELVRDQTDEQVLPREKSTPEKPILCGLQGDLRIEA
jgi:hypothetical protein